MPKLELNVQNIFGVDALNFEEYMAELLWFPDNS